MNGSQRRAARNTFATLFSKAGPVIGSAFLFYSGEKFSQDPGKNDLIAVNAAGSSSDGACPTPGTSTSRVLGSTLHIRSAVARARISLPPPRTIRTGAVIRANGTHRPIGRAAASVRRRLRIAGSVFHTSRPLAACLTVQLTH